MLRKLLWLALLLGFAPAAIANNLTITPMRPTPRAVVESAPIDPPQVPPPTYALSCPSGYSPFPAMTTRNSTTGFLYANFCYNDAGTLIQNAGGGGASPGGATDATQYNAGGNALGGTSVPATPGTFQVLYTPTSTTPVAPSVVQVGLSPRGITSTTDTIGYADNNNNLIDETTAPVAETLPTPTTLQNTSFFTVLTNASAYAWTVTPTTWTIAKNGAAAASTLVINPGQQCAVKADPVQSSVWSAYCSGNAALIVGCGTSAACSAAVQPAKGQIVNGTITFSASTTASITGMPAFSSATSYNCSAADPSHAYTWLVTAQTTTGFTITAGTSNSDTWNWTCSGS